MSNIPLDMTLRTWKAEGFLGRDRAAFGTGDGHTLFLHSPPRLIRMGCVKTKIVPTESYRSDHQGCWSSVTPIMHVVSINGDIWRFTGALVPTSCLCAAVRVAIVRYGAFARRAVLQVLQRDVSVLGSLRPLRDGSCVLCLLKVPLGTTPLFSSHERAPRVWSVTPPD